MARIIILDTAGNVEILPRVHDVINAVLDGELPAIEITTTKITDQTDEIAQDKSEILQNMLLFMLHAEMNYGQYCLHCLEYSFGDACSELDCPGHLMITARIINQ